MKPGTLIKFNTEKFGDHTHFTLSSVCFTENLITHDNSRLRLKQRPNIIHVPVEDVCIYLGQKIENEIYILSPKGPGWTWETYFIKI